MRSYECEINSMIFSNLSDTFDDVVYFLKVTIGCSLVEHARFYHPSMTINSSLLRKLDYTDFIYRLCLKIYYW